MCYVQEAINLHMRSPGNRRPEKINKDEGNALLSSTISHYSHGGHITLKHQSDWNLPMSEYHFVLYTLYCCDITIPWSNARIW